MFQHSMLVLVFPLFNLEYSTLRVWNVPIALQHLCKGPLPRYGLELGFRAFKNWYSPLQHARRLIKGAIRSARKLGSALGHGRVGQQFATESKSSVTQLEQINQTALMDCARWMQRKESLFSLSNINPNTMRTPISPCPQDEVSFETSVVFNTFRACYIKESF